MLLPVVRLTKYLVQKDLVREYLVKKGPIQKEFKMVWFEKVKKMFDSNMFSSVQKGLIRRGWFKVQSI